jgi:hypothetical protein
MALGIPLPGSNWTSFNEGLNRGSDVMQRMMMNPYDMALKQAEAEKAGAEASKAKMLSELISKADPSMAGYFLGLGEPPQTKRTEEFKQTQNLTAEKKRQDIMDHAFILKTAWKRLKRIEEKFNNRPDLTGPVQGTLADWHLSNDKTLGETVPAFAAVQSDLSKSASARPGIGSIQWAGLAKMNAKDPMQTNQGKLKETMDSARQEYDTLRQQYETTTGQKMPTFEQFMGETPKQQAQQISQVKNQQGAPQAATKKVEITPEFANTVYQQMSPEMKKMADEAVDQGANPEDVIREAMKQMGIQEAQ